VATEVAERVDLARRELVRAADAVPAVGGRGEGIARHASPRVAARASGSTAPRASRPPARTRAAPPAAPRRGSPSGRRRTPRALPPCTRRGPGRDRSRRGCVRGPRSMPAPVAHYEGLLRANNHRSVVVAVALGRGGELEREAAQQHAPDRLLLHQGEVRAEAAMAA